MVGSYERAVSDFIWDIPHQFNLGALLSDRQAQLDHGTAIIAVAPDGAAHRYTFDYLSLFSNKLANLLNGSGCVAGDRIAVLLPASVEAAVAHLAILKAGMVSVPLIADEVTAYADRLAIAGVTAICTTASLAETGSAALRQLAGLRTIVVLRDDNTLGSAERMEQALARCSGRYRPLLGTQEQPALLSFTSGSEGTPKGVLHAHGLVPGIIPALLFTGIPKPQDIVWSHFDWGWLGGLLVAFGAWYFGATVILDGNPVVSPGRTLAFMRRFAVTRVSIAPTALRLLQIGVGTKEFPRLSSITTGGEKLDPATAEWVVDRFGIELSEIYGLTECSAILGSGQLVARRPGALGKPAPGQRVYLIDEDGNKVAHGETGQIAVQAPHPAMFLGYWRDDLATRERFHGDLLLTGDLGFQDEDGYCYYVARADDVIKRGGRRIGPGEIESAFGMSAAVDLCAAVGVPDALAGQRIVLWIKLNPSWPDSPQTEAEIMAEARRHLPAYQLPDTIRFVEAMPVTATGKVHRKAVREAETGAAAGAEPG